MKIIFIPFQEDSRVYLSLQGDHRVPGSKLGLAGICSPDALARTLGLEEEGVCGRCIRNIEALMALATREAILRGRSALLGKPDGS